MPGDSSICRGSESHHDRCETFWLGWTHSWQGWKRSDSNSCWKKHFFYNGKEAAQRKNAKALAQMVITMLLPYIGKIRSISTDNGSEFAEHLLIAKRLRTKSFFAHSCSSWEKGCIEYHNKLIRRYIPKEPNFDDISDQMLKEIIIKINKRPRLQLSS